MCRSPLQDNDLRRSLTTVMQNALRDRPGIEGGLWQSEAGPVAWLGHIVRIEQALQAHDVLRGHLQRLLFSPKGGIWRAQRGDLGIGRISFTHDPTE